MDFDSLKNQVSNLTLYDLKAGVRKVQNGKYGRGLECTVRMLMRPFSCDELH